MKCQSCGVNDATIFYRARIGGYETEVRLCEDCAQRMGHANALGVFAILPEELLDLSAFTPAAQRALRVPQAVRTQDSESLVSEEETRALRAERRRNALELRLSEALEAEDYERAAEVRDELEGLDAASEKE